MNNPNVQVVNTELEEGIYFDTDPLGGRTILLHPVHIDLVESLQEQGIPFVQSAYQYRGFDTDVPGTQEWMENNP